MNENEDEIKIILLGAKGVGKTNLINVFFGAQFQTNPETTSTSYCFEGECNHNNKSYRYNIWDTAGQEKYRAINKMFIRGSKIILIVYSIIDRKSFEEIDFWINYIKEIESNGKYILALVANKNDLYLNQIVMEEEGREAAQKYGIDFFTTSALTEAESFKEFLNKLIINYIEIIEGKDNKGDKKKNIKINKDNKNGKPNTKKCC